MPLTIYKRGRFWWLTGTVKTHEGEQRVHESTGETDEEAAHEARLNRENAAKRDREFGPKARYLFSEAVSLYLDAGKPDAYINILLNHFHDTRVADMTGEMVRGSARLLYPTAAYTTWNRQVVTPVKAVINFAADAGKCPEVKIKGFTKRDRTIRRPSTPPKRAVDRSYIDAFRKHSDDPRLSALLLFMFQTGARISDAIKLEDDSPDVDLLNRKVIFRDMKNGDDGEADITIEMVYELQQLRLWKQERLTEWEQRVPWKGRRSGKRDNGRGAKKPNNRVFGFIARGSVYAGIKRICNKAKLPYLGTHQPGRHSFATEMIVRSRVDVVTTAKKGRWSNPQMLLNTYAHEEAGSGVIDKVFGKKTEEKPAVVGDQLATSGSTVRPIRLSPLAATLLRTVGAEPELGVRCRGKLINPPTDGNNRCMTNHDLPPLDQMPDDFPLTLHEACEVFFRGKLKPGSLRAARDRGALVIQRAGRADWVTAGGMREFLRTPYAPPSSPADVSSSGEDRPRVEAALEAAKLVAKGLISQARKQP